MLQSDKLLSEWWNSYQIRAVPKQNNKVTGDDFNAQVGSFDVGGFTFGSKTIRNGKLLLDLMEECELLAHNTRFQNSEIKLWSFTYRNKEGVPGF